MVRRLVWLTVGLGAVLLAAGAGAQGRITGRSGANITLSVGARDGVRAGMTGEVILVTSVGDRIKRVPIAVFRVQATDSASSRAVLTDIGGGFEDVVGAGLEVEFSQPLVRPTPQPTPEPEPPPTPTPPSDPYVYPTPMPWPPATPVPTPEAVELLRQGNLAWDRGDWWRAAELYEALLQQVPGHTVAAQRAPDARARWAAEQRAREQQRLEAEERARRERREKEARERERQNLPLYRETARTHLADGQWDAAASWLARIAVVDPRDSYLQSVIDERLAAAVRALDGGRPLEALAFVNQIAALEPSARVTNLRERAVVASRKALLEDGDRRMAAGDAEGARAQWSALAADAPDHPGLAERLAQLQNLRARFAPSGSEYIYIPPGTFEMGCVGGDDRCSADERPRHEVTITRGFWMKVTEVTVEEYLVFAGASRSRIPPWPPFNVNWRHVTHPIVGVTWEEAERYCRWAGGRLPSEAEWEYAARGGLRRAQYPWGNGTPICQPGTRNGARFDDRSFCGAQRRATRGTEPVAAFGANGHGLHDIAGNVWEWCADWYDAGSYAAPQAIDPNGPSSGEQRVIRGGAWSAAASHLRVSTRSSAPPAVRRDDLGFRCVKSGQQGETP